jgi:hypothetical protein
VNLDGILSRARRMAERLMVDQCIVRRQTGLATDPATGVVSPAYEAIYSGKCKVQTFTNRELMKEAGEHQFVIQRYEVQVPVSAVGIMTNDEVLMTVSAYDADLVGRSYRIVGLMNKSQATARRLGVEEMPS